VTSERGVGGASVGSIKEFYQIVLVIKTSLSTLRTKTNQLRKIYVSIHAAHSEADEQRAAEGITEITQTGNKCAKAVQSLLKETKSESDKLERNDPMGSNSPECRVRNNLLQVLTKKYVDILKDYQDAQNSCRELRMKRARLHVLEAKPNATPEEVDELVRTGATRLVEKSILMVSSFINIYIV